ncbi:hypothetical protein AB0G79_10330 [Streptomyces sp. NPDC020807]|uniref:hypothetical protein n=1 Tax=Streptomyces sp. NPDC020807 TaxID=3155119 RepID=UPI0033EB9C29
MGRSVHRPVDNTADDHARRKILDRKILFLGALMTANPAVAAGAAACTAPDGNCAPGTS